MIIRIQKDEIDVGGASTSSNIHPHAYRATDSPALAEAFNEVLTRRSFPEADTRIRKRLCRMRAHPVVTSSYMMQ